MAESACEFCETSIFRAAEIYFENDHCLYASTHDPETDGNVLPGSGIIVPLAHRETPFDLTRDEWVATGELVVLAKAAVDARLSPDRYTLIWNCYAAGGQSLMHAHLHVIPRFEDEPYAGRGGRWFIKQPENRRPDPNRPGRGVARSS